jgi:GT2 family glycosyltransferase
VLLFLNDDTSVIAPCWLESMLELAIRPEVGAVGAKLLYPDGRIQHAGVVMGIYDNCGHAFKGLDGSRTHYFDFSDIIRDVSAVTGACLMTRSTVFWEVEGFDETQFAVAFNDIDLCLKIRSLGLRVIYTPHAVLHHHEAFSKTSKDLVPHPDEVAGMRSKWEKIIAGDPYYSPNLTRNDEDYSLRTRGA